MDSIGCDTAQQAFRYCNEYNACFNASNTVYENKWNLICQTGGELEGYIAEYYAVLRIECIILALNNTDAMLGPALDACTAKVLSDYDLSKVQIPSCDWPKPLEIASQDLECKKIRNISGDDDASGSAAYRNTWYNNVRYYAPCRSDCCINVTMKANWLPYKDPHPDWGGYTGKLR